MSDSPARIFVFSCSSATYLDCLEQQIFGSNEPWPLSVRRGELCLLQHLDYELHFGLWRATSDGARKIVPKLWGGRFPFQVRVEMVSRELVELPKGSVGDRERTLEGVRAEQLHALLRTLEP